MAEDHSELLQTLMGMLGENPEEKIAAALSSFGISEKPGANVNTPVAAPAPSSASSTALGENADALLKLSALFGSVNQEDERAHLLHALKPFLSEEKQPKIDSAVTILKLVKMAETAGKTDLLKNLKL